MLNTNKILPLIILKLLILPSIALAWTSLEYQQDSRKFKTINLTGSTKFPQEIIYWGFADLEGNKDKDETGNDLNTFYYESHLRKSLWMNIGPLLEFTATGGLDNDNTRAGVFYRPMKSTLSAKKLFLMFKYLPYHSLDRAQQLSLAVGHTFQTFFDKKLRLEGFLDYNYNDPDIDETKIVSEWKMTYHLFDKFHALAEYRYNDYITDSINGLGLGFVYKSN